MREKKINFYELKKKQIKKKRKNKRNKFKLNHKKINNTNKFEEKFNFLNFV